VRGAAIWAVSQLMGRDHMHQLAVQSAEEPDPQVGEEWRLALTASDTPEQAKTGLNQ
jgi:hypothetical protein